VLLGVLALVALLTYGVLSNSPDRGLDDAVRRGERPPMPEFDLPRLAGSGSVSIADYRGKVVVFNIWASWCEPCKEESPLLERWHRKLAAKDGLVLGVDTLDVTSDAKDFIRDYKLTYPMVRDRNGDVIAKLGVVAYPETFVVDRRGRLRAIQRGPVDDAFMRAKVAPLLAEPS
jgi:cytochrome c biogenesis protein CcmG/thiol:disulfide interchange protein DsbE